MKSADAYDPGASFNAKNLPAATGIAYFLPRQLAQVVVTRIKKDASGVARNLADAMKAQARAQGAVDDAAAGVDSAAAGLINAENAIVAATSPSPDAAAILDARLKKRQDALDSAKAELEQANSDLKAATDAIRDLKVGTPIGVTQDYTTTVEISLLPPSADPAHGYRLDPRHSWLRDDTHKLTVSPVGLLTSTNIVAVDRTGDVIVELAQAAGAFAGIAMKPPGVVVGKPIARPPPKPKCDIVPNKVTLIVDFASAQELNDAVNGKLQCLGVRFEVLAHGTVPARGWDQGMVAVNGIAYRTPVEQWVAVQMCARQDYADCDPKNNASVDVPDPMWRTSQVIALRLPQAGPISFLAQKAGFLTRTAYNATFQDGILTSYDDDRPSELVQLAGMPIRTLDGLFDGFSHVLSLRTGVAKAKTGLSQAQKDQITAQYDSLAARIKGNATLTDAQKAALDSQISLEKTRLAGEGSLADAQAGLLQQQNNLAIAQTNAPTQRLDNQVSNTIKALRDQAKLEALRNCLAVQRAAGQPIGPCLD